MQPSEINPAVAEHWHATYVDSEGTLPVLVEIRQTPGQGFLLYTRIRGTEYRICESKFMYVLDELVSQFPEDASLFVPHQIILCDGESERLVELTERIFPFRTGHNIDPGYQMSLFLDGQRHETIPRPEFDFHLRHLIVRLGSNCHFKVCAFCNFLFEDGIFGGTDDHRDLMYCFRDCLDVLRQLRESEIHIKSPSFPRFLLRPALQDVDALHTCAAFTLRSDLDAEITSTRKLLEYEWPGMLGVP